MKLSKILIIFFLIILLFLDYAALDDITTGNEPSFLGEYTILAVSVLLAPALCLFWKKT
ncbi:MAG: hypothetical protein AAB675_02935 [Patescibacteria group bacterium]